MHDIFTFLFAQYKDYTTIQILLEAVAMALGVVSVWYSFKNNILLYPTGLASTILYIYLLYDWQLYGDLLINLYYFYMSIYGWVLWGKRYSNSNDYLKITKNSRNDYVICLLIFIFSSTFVTGVYIALDRFDKWWAYADIIMTGLLFVGTWLLAKRKLENWLFLIAGDIIAIPLIYLKGYTLTSILNVFLTIIAIYGYIGWKKTIPDKKLM